MNYFINCNDREDSCYLEFYRNEWNGQSYWKEDSILISGMDFEDYLYDAIVSAVEDFDYYSVNKITCKQWDKVVELATAIGGETEKL